MRRDGTRLPVELTITRIGLPGPPTFTGYLRDITERVRSERELRASRARLVEVADAGRERIERNLHDGAQQRLPPCCWRSAGSARPARMPEPLLDLAIDGSPRAWTRSASWRGDSIRRARRARARGGARDAGVAHARARRARGGPGPAALPEHVEATVYYVVAEALTNVQHARAGRVVVRATSHATHGRHGPGRRCRRGGRDPERAARARRSRRGARRSAGDRQPARSRDTATRGHSVQPSADAARDRRIGATEAAGPAG